LMFCPADFCGEMNISWSYFQGYCWLFLPLYIGLWIRIYDQILSSHNVWIKLIEISPWTNICGYEWYIIQVFLSLRVEKCQVVMAGTELLLSLVSNLIRVPLGVATLGS